MMKCICNLKKITLSLIVLGILFLFPFEARADMGLPIFFASVRTETKIAGKLLKDIEIEAVRAWVWRANLYSYGFIGLLLLGDMVWLLLKR